MSDSQSTLSADLELADQTDNTLEDAPLYSEPIHPMRRWQIPLLLFVLTILSTFFVGVTAWSPLNVLGEAWSGSGLALRRCFLANWDTGLIFSLSLIGILLAHEMGHYIMTRLYKVESSFPIFIPFPFNPFGTCGALIIMDGRTADRREIFDIGIAGPLAGLLVAIPLAVFGLMYHTAPTYAVAGSLRLGEPLLLQIMDWMLGTQAFANAAGFSTSAASPLLMACWIGLLVTGINMMPISQLDGGHVVFGMIGDKSVWVARAAFAAAAIHIIVNQQFEFGLMLVLVFFLKLRHPPSRDDSRTIGWARMILACISLTLPILCIPAHPITGY